MMKKLCFNLVKKIFSTELEKMQLMSKNKGIEEYKSQYMDNNRAFKEKEYTQLINKPVISVSNEWDNPVVGFVTKVEYISQNNDPVLVVKDYISNEEKMIMGKTYAFTEQRLDAILKLSPFELCCLIYENLSFSEEYNKAKMGIRNSAEEIKLILQKNGFYDQKNNIELNQLINKNKRKV